MDKIKNSKIFNYIDKNILIMLPCLTLFVFLVLFFVNHRMSLSNPSYSNYIYISSDNSNYSNYDPGAWILYKEATLVSRNRLRISYNINSHNLLTEKDKDVLFVINNSELAFEEDDCDMNSGPSTSSKKLAISSTNCTLNRISEAAYRLLVEESDNNNKVGLMTYNENYNFLTNFTDDNDLIDSLLDDIEPEGYTNYYKALEGINAYLENYTFSNDRELKVVIIVRDVSIGNNNQEKILYEEIKQKYPNVTIYALHNMVDEDLTILDKIKNISDYQYLISNSSDSGIKKKGNINNRDNKPASFLNYKAIAQQAPIFNTYSDIFQNIIFNKEYSQFRIVDNINKDYFNFDNFEVLAINYGSVTYSVEDNQLTWTLDRTMITGDDAHLNVELSVKPGINIENEYIPVSTSISIKSMLNVDGIEDEDIETYITPYVKFYNKIYFQTWDTPEGCVVESINPESYSIGDIVDISDKSISCPGYIFVGWNPGEVFDSGELSEDNLINGNASINNYLSIVDGRFAMPGNAVLIYPMFYKIDVNKSISKTTSTLLTGSRIKNLFGNISNGSSNLKAIVRADSLPSSFTPTSQNTISTDDSDYPIYIWFDSSSGTAYYYTKSDIIYLNENSDNLLSSFANLEDISGLSYFNASKVKKLNSAFYNCSKLADISPLSGWDVSNVESMSNLFSQVVKLVDVSPLSGWNVSKVTSMQSLFNGDSSLSSIDALSNWNTSSLTSMMLMFSKTRISDFSVLANWDTSHVTHIDSIFSDNNALTSLDSLANFDVSNVKSFFNVFLNCKNLVDISALENWDVSNANNMYGMFSNCTSITDASALNDWNVINVTNFASMFNLVPTHPEFTKVSGTWSGGTFYPDGGGN